MKCRGLPICCCNFPIQDVLFGLNNGDLGHWRKFQFSLGLIQSFQAGGGKPIIPHCRKENERREKRLLGPIHIRTDQISLNLSQKGKDIAAEILKS